MRLNYVNEGGQTVVEAIVLLPFFAFLVFSVLQLGQLGLGLLITNYGAGSTARKLSRVSEIMPDAAMNAAYKKLLVVGIKSGGLTVCKDTDESTVTSNVFVVADAHIEAFPIIGPMLNALNPTTFTAAATWTMPSPCKADVVPPVGFTGPPKYEFIVRSSALARKNYL